MKTSSLGNMNPSILPDKDKNRFVWKYKSDLIALCCFLLFDYFTMVRVPMYAHIHGGLIVYLIPYILLKIIIGVPLIFFELSLGQFMKTGRQAIGRLSPLMHGVFYVQICITLGYYIAHLNMLLYSLSYLYKIFDPHSAMSEWGTCGNWWNTNRCKEWNDTVHDNATLDYDNYGHSHNNPSSEFFRMGFLQISSCKDYSLYIVPAILLALTVSLVISYLGIFRGIKWMNMIVYASLAIVFFFFLTFAVIVFAVLPGGKLGLRMGLVSDFSHWLDHNLWKDAAISVVYSTTFGTGILTSLSSYNKFDNKLHYDSLFIGAFSIIVSIIFCIVMHGFYGVSSYLFDVNISDIISGGAYDFYFTSVPYLASRIYSTEPVTSVLLCVSIFILTAIMGLGHIIIIIETIFTTIEDAFHKCDRKYFKAISRGIFCFVSFLLGIPFSFNCGYKIFSAIDYGLLSTASQAAVCFFQIISISWVYGIRRYLADIHLMIGNQQIMNFMIFASYAIIIPIFFFGLFIVGCLDQIPSVDLTTYFANMISSFLIVFIPTYMIFASCALPRFCRIRCKYLKSPEYPIHVQELKGLTSKRQHIVLEPLN